jgi:hypothetical protein
MAHSSGNMSLVFEHLEKCFDRSAKACNIHIGLRQEGHDVTIGKVRYAIKLLILYDMVEKDGVLIKIKNNIA